MIEDIKRSLLLIAQNRLMSVENKNYYPDPPTGKYTRPCFYLEFIDKKYGKGYFGCKIFDYSFNIILENKEASDAVKIRTDELEGIYIKDEQIDYYHFVNDNFKFRRTGYLIVKNFRIMEGGKERQKNRIRGELVITF
jgi:hypothetical protein